MQFSVNTLQVCQSDLLLEDHLVETDNEVGIQEATVKNTETEASTDEFEIIQMFGIDTRSRVDLEGIVVVGGILEQTIEWIEHLVRKQEEEFSAVMFTELPRFCNEERTSINLHNQDHLRHRT